MPSWIEAGKLSFAAIVSGYCAEPREFAEKAPDETKVTAEEELHAGHQPLLDPLVGVRSSPVSCDEA